MSKKLVITYEKDGEEVLMSVTGDTMSSDWADVVEKTHDGLVKSLKKAKSKIDKEEKEARDKFIENMVELTGKDKKEIRKELDESDDEKATALRIMLEGLVEKYGKKDKKDE